VARTRGSDKDDNYDRDCLTFKRIPHSRRPSLSTEWRDGTTPSKVTTQSEAERRSRPASPQVLSDGSESSRLLKRSSAQAARLPHVSDRLNSFLKAHIKAGCWRRLAYYPASPTCVIVPLPVAGEKLNDETGLKAEVKTERTRYTSRKRLRQTPQ